MRTNVDKLIKLLKWILAGVFILGIIYIGLYPVPNHDITLKLKTNESVYIVTFTVAEIENSEPISKYVEGITGNDIVEIGLYRKFQSICLDKFIDTSVSSYIEVKDNDVLNLNEDMVKVLNAQAHTYLLERVVYAEVWLTIVVIIWILLTVISEKYSVNNVSNHGPVQETKHFFKNLGIYWEYIVFSAKADLKAEVANSYLNRLWWLLEPFFNMIVYVLIFGRVMGNSIENYATFIYSALLMWNFFSKTVTYSVKCVRNSRDIVTKIYVPKYVLLLSNMVLNFIKMLFSMIVLVIMLIIFQVHIGWNALWVIPAYAVLILFSFGCGMILLHYGVYIDDLSYAVSILLQMVMFLSGPFYDVITMLPVPLNVVMLSINPVAMLMDVMRNGLLYNTMVDLPLLGIWAVLSILLICIGVHIVYKNENSYVKVV